MIVLKDRRINVLYIYIYMLASHAPKTPSKYGAADDKIFDLSKNDSDAGFSYSCFQYMLLFSKCGNSDYETK